MVKHRVSPFVGTDLETLLRANGVDTLVLAGVHTSGVVLSTVRHAGDLDYRLVVIRHCCADPVPGHGRRTWERARVKPGRRGAEAAPQRGNHRHEIRASRNARAQGRGDLVFSEDKTRQGASRRWIMQAVEESLTRLKTDYIDLYQVHVADPETPREETLRALDDLVRQGKVRAIGEAATFATADDLNASQAIAATNGLTPFATMEANYSILVRDAEKTIIPALRDHKMRLLPYFPSPAAC